MRLITKLTIVCILISGLEKLVTYVSMQVFPYCIGESNLLALRVLNVLGLELGTLIMFVVTAMCFVGIKKVADIYPKVEKAATALLIILIIVYGCVLISNLYTFVSIL
jgi:hypothetical protein